MIQTVSATKIYKRGGEEVYALDRLSLEIKKGELLGILGPSGSGKSTLMNLMGLLDRPTGGSIDIFGLPVEKLSNKEREKLRRETIGFIFQQFLLVPTMTALQNVMLPMYFSGRQKARQRAQELLERVGLTERFNHLPSQMSGGETQRVAVARALANQPEILLADEPTGNLDSKTAEEVFSLFKDINRSGTTVVIVTHNTKMSAQLPRIITLQDGRMMDDVKKNAAFN
ncbi:ABC transporter ATP-binding protein [Candidatus Contubernalis alkaliaceticus]|uniref:ABC transporter ATP-binding protein n=1 Tax=Candidatus Contubernalis alkaliaceticus TaxID=338645 RepID=UPI001F4C1E28|nr:ABC transporter ATP-binding protein [Candidatus Contubernalis alkalaceticus]UNC93679.1 ABC transporter ATP-binding protein [Candidatus Contubernalis alkalaceticus]